MAEASADTPAPYVYVVQMDVAKEHENDFNRIYDTEHIPVILGVPGVRACRRYRLESSTCEDTPRYLAIYEMDSPDIVESPAWLEAIEKGDWAPEVRPHTSNRAHHVMRRIS